VVFHYPLHPETYFVKRVVAVPGDRVRMIDKRLFVNGKPEAATYVAHVDPHFDAYRDNFPELRFAPGNVDARWWLEMHRTTSAAGELVVPAGSYFVLGDNRDDSQDSRYWGFVPRANIVGRPLLIYWSRSEVSGSGLVAARGDTLSGLAYAMSHLHTRWDRMLRTVR
jgi:signal peptidase I